MARDTPCARGRGGQPSAVQVHEEITAACTGTSIAPEGAPERVPGSPRVRLDEPTDDDQRLINQGSPRMRGDEMGD